MTTTKAPPAVFTPPTTVAYIDTKPATDETPPAGPAPAAWSDLVVYEVEGFAPAVKVDPKIAEFATYLAAKGEAVIITDGWDPAKIGKFVASVKKLRDSVLGGRRLFQRTGTMDGKPALLLRLSSDTPATG